MFINHFALVYLDSSNSCNELSFTLGANAVGTTIPTRTWSIKVTQYSCDFNNLAPDGCTQYFFGMTTDIIKTYNYDGGEHLANQNQNVCVRYVYLNPTPLNFFSYWICLDGKETFVAFVGHQLMA